MPETGQSENPYLPVYLPEFGLSVGWAMCRNTMCQNFGIQYAGPAPAGAEEIKDDRYTIDTIEGKIRCGYCGNTFTLNSNRAIRTLARHFLSLSIPFATCENPECENFGLNVFEHLAPTRRRQGRPYWVKDATKHRILCRCCRQPDGKETTFALGEPLGLWRSDKSKTRLRQIIRGAMYYRSISMIVEDVDVSEDTYYTQLKRAGERLRDNLAWRNAHLFQEKFAKRDAPLCVYTDTVLVALRRLGKKPRFTQLRIPVSVVDIPEDRTYYILAVHPGFLPLEHCQNDEKQLIREVSCPAHLSPWDCAEHPMRVDSSRPVKDQMGNLPDIGRGGWFTVSPYNDLAHLLTVRKMLSRFPKVLHYMDAEHVQSAAALTCGVRNTIRHRLRVEFEFAPHRSRPFLIYRSHTPSWNAWSGQSGANISTRCRFGTPRISNENWTRSRNITTVIGCIRGSRDKYRTRELAAKTSQQFASMTTAGNRTAAAYFNYQWRLELEFAPHRLGRSGTNISTRCRFGTSTTSNENWTRSRNITTVIGCIRGSRDKCPTREMAAKSSRQLASMTTGGNLNAAAYFNYQWQLELEFAPHTRSGEPQDGFPWQSSCRAGDSANHLPHRVRIPTKVPAASTIQSGALVLVSVKPRGMVSPHTFQLVLPQSQTRWLR